MGSSIQVKIVTIMGSILNNKRLWLVVLTSATLLLHWMNFDDRQMVSALIVSANDTEEHLGATDNWVETGHYSLDGEAPFAARMPGYAFPYVALRLVLDEVPARTVLVVIQLLLYLVAISLSYSWLSERYGATLAFAGAAKLVVFNYVTHVHFRLLPVSFAISLVLILFFLHYRMLRSETIKPAVLLLFGALLTWLGFLRPFLLPIVLLWPLLLMWQRGRWRLKPLVLLFLPFALVEGAWVGRNFAAFGAFVPLQTTFVGHDKADFYRATSTKQSVLHLRPFIIGFGGENVWYFPGSAMHWFLQPADQRMPGEVFPPNVFNAGISADELTELKELIGQSYTAYSDETENEIAARADGLTQRLREHSVLHFYVFGRAKAFARTVASNVTQDWPMAAFAEIGPFGKLYRLVCVAFWAIVFAGGLVLALPRLFRRKGFESVVLLYGTSLLFIFVVQFLHYQYFVYAWLAAFFIWMDAIGSSGRMEKLLARFVRNG